jgi:non-ribosomal peptide synthase protein (TIGR01720 family)
MGLSFLSLGGDSISAMQVVGQLREENITISIRDILRSKNIAELAAMAKTAEQAGALIPVETVNTLFPLSPAQRMFFEMASDPQQQFNQSFTLRLKTSVSPVALETALQAVIQRHSMLRSRFQRVDGNEWAQLISADVTGSYEFREQHAATIHDLLPVASEMQRSLDIEHGPIVGVGSFTVDGGDHLLYLVAHHLAIDLVSWRIIMADLAELIQGRPGSQIAPFPFQAWTEMQAEQAREQLSPAKVLPFEVPAADYAFWGMDDQANTYGDTAEIGFKLDSDTTTMLLGSCNTAMGTEPVDVFLAALIHSFAQTFTERAPPALFSESHGREPWNADIDLSRTVGWFTAISPIFVAGGKDMVDLVRRVKDMRRSVPGNGRPYFASRYLNSECRDAFKKHWPVEVLFNYHGLYQQQERDDSAFEIVPLTPDDFSQDLQRLALFDISATISHGVAEFSLTHNRAMKHQDRIAQWMSTFKNSLSQAVFELIATEQGQKTLSDFPLLPFSRFATVDALKKGLRAVDIKSLADVEDIYPCSPMQESMLAAQGRNNDYYQICNTFELKGAINISRLHRAWQSVVDRHSTLRTTFLAPSSTCGSGRLQIVRRPGVQAARIQHIGDVPVNSAAELGFLCPPQNSHQDNNKSFSPHVLTTGVSADGTRTYMRGEMSHALMDGASLQTVLSELGAAYEQEQPWTGPAPKFSSHVGRLIAAEQDEKTGEAMQYWQKYVKSVAAQRWSSLRVPDNTRYASSSSSSTSCSRSSSPSSSFSSPHDLLRTAVVPRRYMPSIDAMRACCTTHGVTQSSILRAAWALVLSLRNGGISSPRPAFAYLIAGRDDDDDDNNSMAGAVGPFFSTLICALGVSQEKTLESILSDAQSDSVAGMEAASAAPWVKSMLDAEERVHIESMINFRKYAPAKTSNENVEERDATASAGDIEAVATVVVHDPFEYDVVVEAEEDDKGAMMVELKYWGDRVDDGEAEVLATRLAKVLGMLVVDAGVSVEALRRAILG